MFPNLQVIFGEANCTADFAVGVAYKGANSGL